MISEMFSFLKEWGAAPGRQHARACCQTRARPRLPGLRFDPGAPRGAVPSQSRSGRRAHPSTGVPSKGTERKGIPAPGCASARVLLDACEYLGPILTRLTDKGAQVHFSIAQLSVVPFPGSRRTGPDARPGGTAAWRSMILEVRTDGAGSQGPRPCRLKLPRGRVGTTPPQWLWWVHTSAWRCVATGRDC